jgi:DNA processing protein
VVYPAANRRLYERVWAHGLLITEFPPGERPSVHTFPRRNRLISALARVTVVVEAAAGSGALITADAALEQGREVMAVPGNITSHTSVGTNRLLRDGAAPVLEAMDVLEHFPERAREAGEAGKAGEAERREGGTTNRLNVQPSVIESDLTLAPEERRLILALGSEPRTLDDLVAQTELPVPQALAALFSLELTGRVEQAAGLVFRAVTGSR